jgi:hypothetical protein
MAGASRTTFNKRQKERARQEKQAEKAQRKAERRAQQNSQPAARPTDNEVTITYDEEGQPKALDFHDF